MSRGNLVISRRVGEIFTLASDRMRTDIILLSISAGSCVVSIMEGDERRHVVLDEGRWHDEKRYRVGAYSILRSCVRFRLSADSDVVVFRRELEVRCNGRTEKNQGNDR